MLEESKENQVALKGTEFLRGTVPYEFTHPPVSYQKVYHDEIAEEVAAFEQAHQKQYGNAPGPKRINSFRQEVEKKYANQHNHNEQRIALWERSERLLDQLRTKGMVPDPDQGLRDENFNIFIRSVNVGLFPEINPQSVFYQGKNPTIGIEKPSEFSPNQYFQATQPKLVGLYGSPLFTAIATETARFPNHYEPATTQTERIIGINTAFWSGYLGGDQRLHHDVIFYLPEDRFYFFDLAVGCYVPTSEAKLALCLSLSLRQCAYGQQMETAKLILEKFTTKAVLNQILDQAKALLASEAGRFTGPQAKARWTGLPGTNSEASDNAGAIKWVEEWIKPADGAVMALAEVLERFRQDCGDSGATTVVLRNRLEKAIRHVHTAKGLRNDLQLPDGTGVKGWKGFRLLVRDDAEEAFSQSDHFCPKSGQSVESEQTMALSS